MSFIYFIHFVKELHEKGEEGLFVRVDSVLVRWSDVYLFSTQGEFIEKGEMRGSTNKEKPCSKGNGWGKNHSSSTVVRQKLFICGSRSEKLGLF